jgi:adenylate kinase
MRIVIMGPPGAGKGTQAAVISESLGIPHISTGAIFRANVAEGTELGRQAKAYMDRGEYVPDGVVNGMVSDRLAQPDTEPGFLLDGYPRTAAQVVELNRMLAEAGRPLDRAVEITVDTEDVVQRLLKRAQTEGRADDTEEVVRRRLEVYAAETEPLTRLYGEQQILVRVDGMGSVEEVSGRILAALND